MSKPSLIDEDERLEHDIIETMHAGLKRWTDLQFPESHSDMQACVRGIMQMYEINRLPIAKPLRLQCRTCNGLGDLIAVVDDHRRINTCEECGGKGWVPG